jgi:hypothetical protein
MNTYNTEFPVVVLLTPKDIGGEFNPYGVLLSPLTTEIRGRDLHLEIRIARKQGIWGSGSSLSCKNWGFSHGVWRGSFVYPTIHKAMERELDIALDQMTRHSDPALVKKVTKWRDHLMSLREDELLKEFGYEG